MKAQAPLCMPVARPSRLGEAVKAGTFVDAGVAYAPA